MLNGVCNDIFRDKTALNHRGGEGRESTRVISNTGCSSIVGKHLESTRDRGEGRIIASVINGLADYAIMEVGLVCRCKGCNLGQSNGGEVRARSRTSKAWLG